MNTPLNTPVDTTIHCALALMRETARRAHEARVRGASRTEIAEADALFLECRRTWMNLCAEATHNASAYARSSDPA